MDVHVHFFGREGDKQDRERVAPHHEERMVGLHAGRREGRVLHPTPVDKKSHIAAVRAGQRHRADKTADFHRAVGITHFQHLARHVHPVQVRQHLPPVALTAGLQRGTVVMKEMKAHVRVSQRVARHQPVDLLAFCAVSLEEF